MLMLHDVAIFYHPLAQLPRRIPSRALRRAEAGSRLEIASESYIDRQVKGRRVRIGWGKKKKQQQGRTMKKSLSVHWISLEFVGCHFF